MSLTRKVFSWVIIWIAVITALHLKLNLDMGLFGAKKTRHGSGDTALGSEALAPKNC